MRRQGEEVLVEALQRRLLQHVVDAVASVEASDVDGGLVAGRPQRRPGVGVDLLRLGVVGQGGRLRWRRGGTQTGAAVERGKVVPRGPHRAEKALKVGAVARDRLLELCDADAVR